MEELGREPGSPGLPGIASANCRAAVFRNPMTATNCDKVLGFMMGKKAMDLVHRKIEACGGGPMDTSHGRRGEQAVFTGGVRQFGGLVTCGEGMA